MLDTIAYSLKNSQLSVIQKRRGKEGPDNMDKAIPQVNIKHNADGVQW